MESTFILLIGSWGAKVISGIVKGASSRIGIDNTEILGTITCLNSYNHFYYCSSLFKIKAEILTNILLILIASINIVMVVFFDVGSKDILNNIIYGVYLTKSIKVGEIINIGNDKVKIIQIGTILTKIELNNDNILSLPIN